MTVGGQTGRESLVVPKGDGNRGSVGSGTTAATDKAADAPKKVSVRGSGGGNPPPPLLTNPPMSDAEGSSEAPTTAERYYDFADDEDSDGDDEGEEEEEEEDLMEDTEEEEEEMRSSEEEALDELHLLQERKNLYEQSKKKQRQLIEKYFESIEKLKKVRMKNMYLQDRIHQHLVEKSKILAECREAVKLRKEMINKMETEVTRPQMNHYQFETLQRELDRQDCEGKWEKIEVEQASSHEEEEEEEEAEVTHDASYLRLKLCKKLAKEYRKKHEKGLSKLERLSLEHYHFEKLHTHDEKQKRKEEQLEKERLEQEEKLIQEEEAAVAAAASAAASKHSKAMSVAGTDDKSDIMSRLSHLSDHPSIASYRISMEKLKQAEHVKEQLRESTTIPEPQIDLEKLHQLEIKEEKYLDPANEWKYKMEKSHLERKLQVEQHKHELHDQVVHAANANKNEEEELLHTTKIILDEETMEADMDYIDKQEATGEKKTKDLVLPTHDDAPVDEPEEVPPEEHHHHHHHIIPDSLNKPAERTQSLQEHHERINQRNMCRAKKYRLLKAQREKLEEFREIQETIIKVDKDDDDMNEEAGLPEFTFMKSDPSLTNMSFGEKLRNELEKMVKQSKIPINLDWPLTVRGFRERFQKPNAYGKIVYTMRSDNQIKATKKSSRKYKYVLHNLNYLRQQKATMEEVHQESMQYFELSKLKWETALEQLLVKFLNEIRDAATEAIDSTGRKLPAILIDKWCHEVIRGVENVDNTAKLFHQLMNSVGIIIRDLIHSESRGEGVELYEYNSLLRTNETIGAQYYRKQYDLEESKERCRSLDSVYMKTLTMKENVAERVTSKYQLCGELSCLLIPKQKAMKFNELKAKSLIREHEKIHLKAGIVPYSHLVTDYEKTYINIGNRRHERMDLQLKYNSRVREVHQIYDSMEEVQRMIPQNYERNWPLEFDLCGVRPKTAPASTLSMKQSSTMSLAGRPATQSSKKPPIIYLTKPESHTLLAKTEESTRNLVNLKHAKSTSRIHAIKETIYGDRPKTAASFTSRSSGGFMTAVPRPNTAAAAVPSIRRMSKSSVNKIPLGGDGDAPPEAEANLSQLVALEEIRSKNKFKRGVVVEKYPTQSKTGIVAKVTPATLVKDTGPRKTFEAKNQHIFTKSPLQKPGNTRPFTAPAMRPSFESEIKNWPFKYYTKKSKAINEDTSATKRHVNAVLGGISRKSTTVDAKIDETTIKEISSKYADMS